MTPPWSGPLLLALLLVVGCERRPALPGPDAPDADAEASVEVDAPAADVPRASEIEVGPEGPPRAGLVPLTRAAAAIDTDSAPHLGQIVLGDGVAWVANSFHTVAVFELGPDAELSHVTSWPDGERPFCTTLAVHSASESLYCGGSDGGGRVGLLTDVHRLSLEDPLLPAGAAHEVGMQGSVLAHLLVVGDWLVVSALASGLQRASIAADGTLGEPEPLVADAHAVQAEALTDTLLAVVDVHGGVWLVEVDGGEPVVGPAAQVEGPPLDLAADAGRLAVAAGSQGVGLLGVDEASKAVTPLQVVQPSCVATAVALRGDLLAVACATGVQLFDLAGDTSRPVGSVPAERVMLDVRFLPGGQLLVSDWHELLTVVADPGGAVVLPQVDRSRYTRPGEAATFVLRNPGHRTLAASLYRQGEPGAVAEVTAGPGEQVEVELPAAPAVAGTGVAHYALRSEAADATWPWGYWWDGSMRVVTRPPGADPALGRPAVGDPFPELRVSSAVGGDDLLLPSSGVRQRVVSHTEECVAMWPQLRDLAWLVAHGQAPDGAEVVAIDGRLQEMAWFVEAWGLEALVHGNSAGGVGSLLVGGEVVAEHGAALYDEVLFVPELPGGAHHPTDYVIDELGTVVAVERMYRGAWPLRAELAAE